MKTGILKLTALLLLTAPMSAFSLPIHFSFADDAQDWPLIGRSHVAGVVEGILHGLEDDGTNLAPTSIEFLSDVSILGMADSAISFQYNSGGFDLENGTIVAANFIANFNDSAAGGMQIRFNFSGMNMLHWNGGPVPIAGQGNQDGFHGATYGRVTPVPEPATLLLLALGLCGISIARLKKG